MIRSQTLMRREQLRDGKTKVVSVFDRHEARKHRTSVHHQNKAKGVGSMRHQNKIKIQRRRRRKFFWLFAAAAVSALVFGEQVALLYVLSTLAMCGLLIAVAFSNLEAKDAEMQAAAVGEEADNRSARSRKLGAGKRRAA